MTDKWQRYLRLLRRHGLNLIISFGILLRMRLFLTFRNYKVAAKWIESRPIGVKAPRSVAVLAWSVKNAARLIPRASCLTQALALRYLLHQQGDESVIRVGLRANADIPFEAHAWLLHKDQIVLGGTESELATFSSLVDL